MIFNSITYFIFLAIFVSIFWNIGVSKRKYLISLGSVIFYGFWSFLFVPLILFSSFSDFLIAQFIEKSRSTKTKKLLLVLSIFINLGLLIFFKYSIFIQDNLIGIGSYFGFMIDPFLRNIILPIGISFYTFQTISYSVDVYREDIVAEKDVFTFISYVTFFPQLVAGPILRASDVIPQIKANPPSPVASDFVIGVRRIITGLFIKVVLADSIGIVVDKLFDLPLSSFSVIDISTLAFLFGFQIYFDFAGYSSIAIGSALLIGIKFPENFNFPYIAKTPRDFWLRWHISLSSWIRDYLYSSLAAVSKATKSGSQSGMDIRSLAIVPLFLTWGIMGLWHGASWTFVAWGLYHAILITVFRVLYSLSFLSSNRKILDLFWHICTLYLVMLSWIFFRSDSLNDSFTLYQAFFDGSKYFYLGLKENYYLIAAILLSGFYSCYFWSKLDHQLVHFPAGFRYLTTILSNTLMVILIIVFMNDDMPFIYFQF
jgi:alginate O-acetyltransferase complex protein AlgI|tara:strand:- start:4782 stop:6233 length:1452 start_codon:yes stop_codon:yes gene_type:complete